MEGEAKGRRIIRNTSPSNRGKVVIVKPNSTNRNVMKKVQVVYYLCRNGQLEHPHYVEVSHLAHQHLRLKDVMDRLTVLRGKGMPSLYSWSCKRSYKNGYVWNDLADDDIIYPSSEGAEYVLKGSELIEGCTEKFQQQLQVSNRTQAVVGPDTTFHSKRMTIPTKRHPDPESDNNIKNNAIIQYEYENDDDIEENIAQDHHEYCRTSSATPQHYLRCSRGVSTNELTELTRKNNTRVTELSLDRNSSPPSTTSSTASDKATNEGNASKRFEPDGESPVSRNSVLLQLISCGSTSFRAKTVPAALVTQQQHAPPPCTTTARKSSGSSDLRKAAAYKSAKEIERAAGTAAEEDEEELMLRCMSENPRFGNLQSEEKEYFSGSIAEAIVDERDEEVEKGSAGFKRSSSYNEDRCKKAELCEEAVAQEEQQPKRDKIVLLRGKCIPRIMYTSPKQPKN